MRSAHREPLIDLLRATGSFREEEIDVAVELFDEACARVARPDVDAELPSGAEADSGGSYRFIGLFADPRPGQPAVRGSQQPGSPAPASGLVGYACFGPTPSTDGTFDLYWIAVHPSAQGLGGGRLLLNAVEERIAAAEGRMVVVETSSRSDYEGTRRFYDRGGYREGARVRDFYAPHDDRVIFTRQLPKPVAGGASQQ
jgi:ribosomal protein S18 acetylase RimI-like enzyme